MAYATKTRQKAAWTLWDNYNVEERSYVLRMKSSAPKPACNYDDNNTDDPLFQFLQYLDDCGVCDDQRQLVY